MIVLIYLHVQCKQTRWCACDTLLGESIDEWLEILVS